VPGAIGQRQAHLRWFGETRRNEAGRSCGVGQRRRIHVLRTRGRGPDRNVRDEGAKQGDPRSAREDQGGRLVSLQLYGHPFSSYTWKALIPLYANSTHFEVREIDPSETKFESFCGRVHPSGQFPVLVDGDAIVVEASSIVEHLAVHHPGPARLIPDDPAEAVVVRMLDRVFDHYVMGYMQRITAAYFVNRDDPAAG